MQKPVVETTKPAVPTSPATKPATPSTNTNATTKPTAPSTEATKPTTPSTSTIPSSYPKATENHVLFFMESTQNIGVGQTVKADYVYYGSGKLSWHVDYPRGFKVDQSGNMTPLVEGNYVVYVTDGTYTAKTEVFAPQNWWGSPHSVYFDNNRMDITAGTSRLIPVTDGTDFGSSWYSSSDPSVVKVEGAYLTALNPGTAVITAHRAYCNCKLIVTVKPAAQTVSLKLNQNEASLYRHQILQLKADYNGSNPLTWSSSHNCIAVVDENGLVTARREGTCEIYVSDGTFAAKCTVTVSVDPAVQVNKLEIQSANGIFYDGVTRYKNDYIKFQVRSYPDNASTGTYIQVSDPSITRVSREYFCCAVTFRLDFKKAGTCVVKIVSGDGAVTNTYTVHVKEDYDANPGSGILTPEQFVDCYNAVLNANGMSQDYMPTGYLVLFLTPEQLTWQQARKGAEGLSHHWWSIGYRHMILTFEGINEDGMYVFYERGC